MEAVTLPDVFVQWGALGIVAFIVFVASKWIPRVADRFTVTLEAAQDRFVAANERRDKMFLEVNERRDTRFLAELRAQRDAHRGQMAVHDDALGELTAAVKEQTVAIIAAAQGGDADEAVSMFRKKNGRRESA